MVTSEKIYCHRCEQRLYPKKWPMKGDVMIEFKEGIYCHNCGKVKVEEARKNKPVVKTS